MQILHLRLKQCGVLYTMHFDNIFCHRNKSILLVHYTCMISRCIENNYKVVRINIARFLYGKCCRMSFLHALIGFHKANELVQRANELCENQLKSAKMPYKSTSEYEICLFYKN